MNTLTKREIFIIDSLDQFHIANILDDIHDANDEKRMDELFIFRYKVEDDLRENLEFGQVLDDFIDDFIDKLKTVLPEIDLLYQKYDIREERYKHWENFYTRDGWLGRYFLW